MPDCPHLLDPRACAQCTPTAREQPRASRVFPARHDTVCGGCDFDIRPGQAVRFDTDDRLKHATCVQGAA